MNDFDEMPKFDADGNIVEGEDSAQDMDEEEAEADAPEIKPRRPDPVLYHQWAKLSNGYRVCCAACGCPGTDANQWDFVLKLFGDFRGV